MNKYNIVIQSQISMLQYNPLKEEHINKSIVYHFEEHYCKFMPREIYKILVENVEFFYFMVSLGNDQILCTRSDNEVKYIHVGFRREEMKMIV